MQISHRNKNEKKLIEKMINAGNADIFFFWNELTDDEKDGLIKDISQINLKKTERNYKSRGDIKNSLTDFDVPETYKLEDRKDDKLFSSIGEKAIRKGELAYLTVAGGQGTRLNFDHPKGCFPITPARQKTLFRLFAEKIKYISLDSNANIKWLIMTSGSNDAETRKYFEENFFFGLDKNNVIFFIQNMLPTLSADGNLILSEKNKIYKNPDGHGGSLKAMLDKGILKNMSDNGIKYLYYFQVDNPMVDLYDKVFLGYHIGEKYAVSTKVIKKNNDLEKLGLAVKLKNGKNAVIEYSDLPQNISGERNENGKLKFIMGSIGIHVFNVEFLSGCTKNLPVHCAKKRIEAYRLDKNGKMERAFFECLKFEFFVFDVIRFAKKSAFFECERSEEFSPLKNKTGNDSIASCKDDQIKKHLSWLEDSGLLGNNGVLSENLSVEISPLYAPCRNIFLGKAAKDSDNLKKIIFDNNGKLKNEIYIE